MAVMMTNKVGFKYVLYGLSSITSLIFDILYTVQYAVQSNRLHISIGMERQISTIIHCAFLVMAVMTKRRENHVFERIVEFHKYAIMENSELKSSAELVRFAIKHGIVSE